MNALGHEMKRGATLHLDRLPRMMREHKDRAVIRRLVTPPPFPAVITPLATVRAEHVAAENPRAEAGHATRRKIIVDARRAIRGSKDRGLKRARRKNPLVQRHAAHAERIRKILTRTGAVTVERDTETVDAKFGPWGLGAHGIRDNVIENSGRAVGPMGQVTEVTEPKPAVEPMGHAADC